MKTAKKLFTTKRRVKLFDRRGKLWEEIEIPPGVVGGSPKVVTMADRVVFPTRWESLRECGDVYRAPLPYYVGIGH
jgi:hypothetical protein